MHADCIAEIATAIGRQPTKAQLARIEGSLTTTMREMARADPASWQALSHAQRMAAAAEKAATDAMDAAQRQAERRAMNLVAQVREGDRLKTRAVELAARGKAEAHHAALFERMIQVESYAAGVRNESLSHLVDAIHAVEPRFLGLMHDAESVANFARAVMGEPPASPAIGRAAKAYIDAMETMRQRSNAAGTEIGKLDYGYLPPAHDTGRIAQAGAEKWAADTLPRLDRGRYFNDDGTAMDDAQVLDLLRGAWTTLATEGRNKREPGKGGQGSRAARFDDAHRVLHFKDADAYLANLADYGRGSMMDAILGHVGQMSKNIALMEEFGPNPNATFRLLKDTAEIADNTSSATHWSATPQMMWDTLSGVTAQPVSPQLAAAFQGIRNFTTAAKLQGVMLSSVTDAPMQVLVAKSAGVPIGDAVGKMFSGFGKDARVLAHDLALGVDELAGEMSRWHPDHLAQGWTSKLANATMRATLVEGWTNGLRRSFALTLSRTLERMRRTEWGALGEFDKRRLTDGGVTETDWRIWQAAEAEQGMLTKNGVRAVSGFSAGDVDRATARLLGYLDAEGRTAVLAPDLATRAMLQQGTRSGTWGGEILRSMMLFKSFPLAIVQKHVRRLSQIPTAQGKVAYSAAMMTSLTLFGAAAMSLKDLANGKDPRDPATKEFWLAAAAQGGGLGIFGDALYTGLGGNARNGQANWTSFAGPVFGNAFDAMNVARKGLGWAVGSEEDSDKLRQQFGAEALRFTKGNTPFVNLWYTRAAIDHLVLHDMQEQLSPGYLRKMKARARTEWEQEFWWEPGEALPDRAPDVASDGR